jgi:hypothetical protein
MSYLPNESIAPNTASPSAPLNDHNFPESVLWRIFDLVIQGPVALPPPIDDQRQILAQVCQRWRHVVTLASTYSGFQGSPSLRHVSIRIPNGVHGADLRLPWSRLARIDLGNTPIRLSKFLKILEQSFTLEDGVFCINFALSYHRQSPIFRTIVIPLVRHLRLRLIHPGKDARVLGKLRMPSLESVWLEREEAGRSTRDMALYATILARWNAPLEHITVADHSFPKTTWFLPRLNRIPQFMTYQQLDGVFLSAYHLTSLYLCPGVFIHPLVLERLASGECLPFLEKLGISSISGWDVIWMALERGFASIRPESGPSSNSASFMAPMTRPVALNYISLFIMGCGLDRGTVWKLKDALNGLHLSCGFAFQYADILSLDSSIS